jgi:hypothetical protein
VAARILQVLGRADVELVGVGSDYFAEEFFSSRPSSETMRNMVLGLQGMDTMPNWRAALDAYLQTEFTGLDDRDPRVVVVR